MLDYAEEQGYGLLTDAVPETQIEQILRELPSARDDQGGLRDLFRSSATIRELATGPTLRPIVDQILGPEGAAVRVLLFDKRPGANWKVVWHQDVTIAVQSRHEVPGYGPWSMKAGVHHVQPPEDVLEQMLTLRVHLDPCPAENGPLRVLPGSHRFGKLSLAAVASLRTDVPAVECVARAGDVLAIRPLLVHASSPAAAPRHRRVIHIEYAATALAHPLQWYDWLPASRVRSV